MTDFPNYDMKRIEKAIDELRLHFDTVQIFCTRVAILPDVGETTQTMHNGSGNYYARYGQVKSFIHDEEMDYITKGKRNCNQEGNDI